MHRIGAIQEIWRYPVKSMGGERLEAADIREHGLLGDRLWALRDERARVITGAKRLPALLSCSARFTEPPGPSAGPGNIPPVLIELADGSEISSSDPRVHARLSDFLGCKVTLCPLRDAIDRRHYRANRPTLADLRQIFGVPADEPVPDLSMFSVSKLIELTRFATPPGTYFDAYPLHVLTTSSLNALQTAAPLADFDTRRFRPNLLIDTNEMDGLIEFEWCGGTLFSGECRVHLEIPTVRCSMPSRAQRELQADARVMKTIATRSARCLGVYASVARPGRVAVGDSVLLDPARRSRVRKWSEARGTELKRLLLRGSASLMPKA